MIDFLTAFIIVSFKLIKLKFYFCYTLSSFKHERRELVDRFTDSYGRNGEILKRIDELDNCADRLKNKEHELNLVVMDFLNNLRNYS